MNIRSLSLSSCLCLFLALILFSSGNAQKIDTGLEILIRSKFENLKGKRVGLITNPTGVDRNLISVIDLMYRTPGVKLVALYSPEHGIRGEFTAGESVGSVTDPVLYFAGST